MTVDTPPKVAYLVMSAIDIQQTTMVSTWPVVYLVVLTCAQQTMAACADRTGLVRDLVASFQLSRVGYTYQGHSHDLEYKIGCCDVAYFPQ